MEKSWLSGWNTQFVRSELWVQIPEKADGRVGGRKARSNRVFLFTWKQTPVPCTGDNDVEYKWKRR